MVFAREEHNYLALINKINTSQGPLLSGEGAPVCYETVQVPSVKCSKAPGSGLK